MKKWIKTKDIMPPLNEEVLILFKEKENLKTKNLYCGTASRRKDPYFGEGWTDFAQYPERYEVIYWMPLACIPAVKESGGNEEERHLFKAISMDRGDWVVGYLVKNQEWAYIVVPLSNGDFGFITVIPETVCKFRGVKDPEKGIPAVCAADKVLTKLEEEKEYAYADFEAYVNDVSPCLDAEYDDLFHRGLERAIEIVKEIIND